MPPWALAQVSEVTTPLVRERPRPGKGPPLPRGPSYGSRGAHLYIGWCAESSPRAARGGVRVMPARAAADSCAHTAAPRARYPRRKASRRRAGAQAAVVSGLSCTARRVHATAGAGVHARTWADDDDLGLLGHVRATKDTMPSRAAQAGHAVCRFGAICEACEPRRPLREWWCACMRELNSTNQAAASVANGAHTFRT